MVVHKFLNSIIEFLNNINYKALLCAFGVILIPILGIIFPYFGCILITIVCILAIICVIVFIYDIFDELLN